MATPPTPTHLRVLVTADLTLVADTVRIALDQRGHQVVVMRWPRGGRRSPGRRAKPPPPGETTEIGLLLCALDSWSGIRTARGILERVAVPWIALTPAPRGPAWGGLLSAGARLVLAHDVGLDQVEDLLRSVALGATDTPEDERASLEAAWLEACERHEVVTERISSLTPREAEVLRLLYDGATAAAVSEALEVSVATVRTQVKGVLRKLDVQTQLAAVATFADAFDEWGQRPSRRLPAPPSVVVPSAGRSPDHRSGHSSGGRQPT